MGIHPLFSFMYAYNQSMKNQYRAWLYALLAFMGLGFVACSVITHGVRMLQYYTELSNIIGAAGAGIMAYDLFRSRKIPLWLKRFRFVGVCLTTVTFLVVIFILAPQFGFLWILFSGQMKYTHTICPILSAVLFVLFEKEPALKRKDCILAVYPTMLYGAVTLVLNWLNLMYGPYPFLHVHEQPWFMTLLWVMIIFGGNYLIALVFYRLGQRNS